MSAPDLLILDCDGVLVDSEHLAVEAFVQVMNEAGVPATVPMIERHFGMKQADILTSVSESTGRDIPDVAVARLWPVTRVYLDRALRPMPGIVDFLAANPGLHRCVASSSHHERIRFSLERTGLDRFFGDAVFSAQQVARGKPAPDLFLFAAARMGVEPRACTVVEDSVYGVRAAVSAGMRAIGFVGGSHTFGDHAQALRRYGASVVERNWAALSRHLV